MPIVPAGQVALALWAHFGKESPPIGGGLTWRVYSAKRDAAGNYRLVKEDKSPAPTLVLPAGAYIVHVGFGLATAVKPVTLNGPTVHESFDLPAGALRLEGRVGDVRIPAGQISFDVYKGSQFEPGDRRPIAEHVMTGNVVVVPEGTYYIVSNYGDANSVVRSDIRVRPPSSPTSPSPIAPPRSRSSWWARRAARRSPIPPGRCSRPAAT